MLFVWLDWIDQWNFILYYGLVHTWFPQTTHKSNVQWMPISFVWLSVFKCDVCVLNHMWIKPKKIFDRFICNWKCFLSLFVSRFCTYFVFQCFNLVEKQGSESFASCLRVVHDLVVSCEVEKCIFDIQAETFASSSQVRNSWNSQISYFMGIS